MRRDTHTFATGGQNDSTNLLSCLPCFLLLHMCTQSHILSCFGQEGSVVVTLFPNNKAAICLLKEKHTGNNISHPHTGQVAIRGGSLFWKNRRRKVSPSKLCKPISMHFNFCTSCHFVTGCPQARSHFVTGNFQVSWKKSSCFQKYKVYPPLLYLIGLEGHENHSNTERG